MSLSTYVKAGKYSAYHTEFYNKLLSAAVFLLIDNVHNYFHNSTYILFGLGCDVRIFTVGLPVKDDMICNTPHPKVQELRGLSR